MTAQCPILLVDDNSAHRRLIRRALEKAEFASEIIEADSLSSARSLLFENDTAVPCVAVVDLDLGDGIGTELIREMRASEKYASVPIIVLSTSSLENDIEASRLAGADTYVTKSENPIAFAADIAAAISKMIDCT